MYISESGILGDHLGGQGSVKRYFKNGKVFKDGLEQKSHRIWINLVGTILN